MEIPQRLRPEYYDMTIQEIIDDMNNYLLTLDIKGYTAYVKQQLYWELKKKYPVEAARGGEHYGLFYTPPAGIKSFKFTMSLKKTGDLVQMTKLKQSYEMKLNKLKFCEDYDKNVTPKKSIINLIRDNEKSRLTKKIMVNPMDKDYVFRTCLGHVLNIDLSEWDENKLINCEELGIRKPEFNDFHPIDILLDNLYSVNSLFNYMTLSHKFMVRDKNHPIQGDFESKTIKQMIGEFCLFKEDEEEYRRKVSEWAKKSNEEREKNKTGNV